MKDFLKSDFYRRRYGVIWNMTDFERIIVALASLVVIGIMLWFGWKDYQWETYNAPCSYFAHLTASSIPARCLKYYAK